MTDLFAPLVIALAASVVLGGLVARLRPRCGAWLMSAAIALLFIVVLVTSWTVALAFVGHEPLTRDLLGWCSDPFGAHRDPSRAAGIAAVVMAAWSSTRIVSTVRRWRNARGDGSVPVNVIASGRPLAYAQTGRHGGIVVSTAMLAALQPDERRVLLAHEQAHIVHRHDRFLIVGSLVAGLFPLVFAAGALRHCLERWADEDAALTVGDRLVVARAVARAALVGHDRPALALGVVGGDVPARVEAMTHPPMAKRAALAWAMVATSVVLVSMVAASVQLHHLAAVFEAFCPTRGM